MPKPSPAAGTFSDPITFPTPTADATYEAALLLSTPAKERDEIGRTRAATTAARETLVLASAALLVGLPAAWAGVQVRTADGGTYALSRMVRILTCGDSRTIGRIVGRA